MGLKEDLEENVADIFQSYWDETNGTVVPDAEDVALEGNEGINLDTTVLYADLSGSTDLVDRKDKTFAAEIYKTFLLCAAKVIRSEDGEVTAYDGDRVMAVFIGKQKNTSAVRTALKINWAVRNIIRPAQMAQYPDDDYVLKHVVGVATSKLMAARTGVRGDNDLVWVGKAANHAAKLNSLPDTHTTYITEVVYDAM